MLSQRNLYCYGTALLIFTASLPHPIWVWVEVATGKLAWMDSILKMHFDFSGFFNTSVKFIESPPPTLNDGIQQSETAH